jgi:hypothetical protein
MMQNMLRLHQTTDYSNKKLIALKTQSLEIGFFV